MSEPNRLRLTAEDIAATDGRVTAPPVLTIGLADIPDVAPPSAERRHGIQITADDVAAFEPAGETVVGPLEQQLSLIHI